VGKEKSVATLRTSWLVPFHRFERGALLARSTKRIVRTRSSVGEQHKESSMELYVNKGVKEPIAGTDQWPKQAIQASLLGTSLPNEKLRATNINIRIFGRFEISC
jgi:hypothetical protein